MNATKWTVDPTHSEINFKVKHLMITNVTGSFGKFEINASTDGDDFTQSKIEFTAETDSVLTGNADRDNHLKSADFFDAANYPKIQFTATGYKKGNEVDELTGDLTIKNVTKSVTLHVENSGIAKDPWGNLKAGFSISGKLNRKDFGLTWNAAMETGGVLVSDEVKISCEIQLVKLPA
ncbi:MAG: YceI family protein [Crocinitomicaceae bacterium]|nr:YceI family protein [Crocinitomicaceae bacterium]